MSEGAAPSRAQPFYCPYCGENDFVPFGDEAGSYACESCERRFAVKFLGLGLAPPAPDPVSTKET